MNLAKKQIDLGLFSNRRDAQLAFWQQEVGLPYDHMGKLGGGMQQHRHHMQGSILKMNHARDPLPALPPSGYRRLRIARPDLSTSRELADPDGNPVTLVPQGQDGVEQIAIEMTVSNRAAFDHFWGHVMQQEIVRPGVARIGQSLLLATEEAPVSVPDAWSGPGYRYITVQIFDALAEHEGILARGGTEGQAPKVLGDTVRFSFVRDPDGNWIEVSQRASLTGGSL